MGLKGKLVQTVRQVQTQNKQIQAENWLLSTQMFWNTLVLGGIVSNNFCSFPKMTITVTTTISVYMGTECKTWNVFLERLPEKCAPYLNYITSHHPPLHGVRLFTLPSWVAI